MTIWQPQQTEDGSFTFYSDTFKEAFHSRQGAKAEAFVKFAQATELTQQAQRGHIRLLDVCYGLGYNTAAAIETIGQAVPDCSIEVYGLELDASVPLAATEPPLIDSWTPPVQEILRQLARHHRYEAAQLTATLLIGDARQTIQQLTGRWQADAIFFDPFSPRRCPQLWTVEFFQQVAACLTPTGKLATYSRSAAVRSALLDAGLQIGTIPLADRAFSHEWSQGTIASFESATLVPLSAMEQEHLQTRAAIPYRDPTLADAATQILDRHALEQQQSDRESTSRWRKRWGIR